MLLAWRLARMRRRILKLERAALGYKSGAFQELRRLASGEPVERERRQLAGEAPGRIVRGRMVEGGYVR